MEIVIIMLAAVAEELHFIIPQEMVVLAAVAVAVLRIGQVDPKAQAAAVQEILVLMDFKLLVVIQKILVVVLVVKIRVVEEDVLEHGAQPTAVMAVKVS
jgi:hypothetical protein